MKIFTSLFFCLFFSIACQNNLNHNETQQQNHQIKEQDEFPKKETEPHQENESPIKSTLPSITNFSDCHPSEGTPLTECEWLNIPDIVVYGEIANITWSESPSQEAVVGGQLVDECQGLVSPALKITLKNIHILAHQENITPTEEITFYIGRDTIGFWNEIPSESSENVQWHHSIQMMPGDSLGATLFKYDEKYSPLTTKLFQIKKQNNVDRIVFQETITQECPFFSPRNLNQKKLIEINQNQNCNSHNHQQIKDILFGIYATPTYSYAGICHLPETPIERCGGHRCDSGYFCWEEQCVFGCMDSAQCPEGYPCISGACIECASGQSEQSCQEKHYCNSNDCGDFCFNNSDCEDGSLCVAGDCLLCSTREECRAPWEERTP